MSVPGRRLERLGEQIRQEISALLVSGLRDPRIGFSTITEVRVTPDLRHAHISVSVLGSADAQEETLKGFRAAAAYIRRELAHRSLVEIGDALGGRDHSTVHHGWRKMERHTALRRIPWSRRSRKLTGVPPS